MAGMRGIQLFNYGCRSWSPLDASENTVGRSTRRRSRLTCIAGCTWRSGDRMNVPAESLRASRPVLATRDQFGFELFGKNDCDSPAAWSRPMFETLDGVGIEQAQGVLQFRDEEEIVRPFVEWTLDERVRKCCEAGKKLKVAVLVSGGVDSSVALRLLCDLGHSCTAFYLKIWFQEDFDNFWSACPWEEDLNFAKNVCDEVGIELKVVHLTDIYWSKVVLQSISEIEKGRTPNPDILCNSRIKFGAFLDHIQGENFDRVASGHYARVERVGGTEEDPLVLLHLAVDQMKDQTYFLSHLSQSQMSRVMFPLGLLSKVEVRLIAESLSLANRKRKDSQGICFLGKVKFSEFIAKHLGVREGCLLEAETGELLGTHKGFWFYTIGQRQGLGLSNGPWFVVAKDIHHNVVFISRNYYENKSRRTFRVGSLNWISGTIPFSLDDLRCKVRHGPTLYDCSMEFDDAETGNCTNTSDDASLLRSSALVRLSQDDQGLALGQFAVFYQRSVCLGSGVITETFSPTLQNVSEEALQAVKVSSDPSLWNKRKRL